MLSDEHSTEYRAVRVESGRQRHDADVTAAPVARCLEPGRHWLSLSSLRAAALCVAVMACGPSTQDLAEEKLKQGRSSEAMVLLQRVLDEEPTNRDAYRAFLQAILADSSFVDLATTEALAAAYEKSSGEKLEETDRTLIRRALATVRERQKKDRRRRAFTKASAGGECVLDSLREHYARYRGDREERALTMQVLIDAKTKCLEQLLPLVGAEGVCESAHGDRQRVLDASARFANAMATTFRDDIWRRNEEALERLCELHFVAAWRRGEDEVSGPAVGQAAALPMDLVRRLATALAELEAQQCESTHVFVLIRDLAKTLAAAPEPWGLTGRVALEESTSHLVVRALLRSAWIRHALAVDEPAPLEQYHRWLSAPTTKTCPGERRHGAAATARLAEMRANEVAASLAKDPCAYEVVDKSREPAAALGRLKYRSPAKAGQEKLPHTAAYREALLRCVGTADRRYVLENVIKRASKMGIRAQVLAVLTTRFKGTARKARREPDAQKTMLTLAETLGNALDAGDESSARLLNSTRKQVAKLVKRAFRVRPRTSMNVRREVDTEEHDCDQGPCARWQRDPWGNLECARHVRVRCKERRVVRYTAAGKVEVTVKGRFGLSCTSLHLKCRSPSGFEWSPSVCACCEGKAQKEKTYFGYGSSRAKAIKDAGPSPRSVKCTIQGIGNVQW